ncbi:MAG: heavy metal translocating P-type ATPase [Puniceicoccaceae bacterium]
MALVEFLKGEASVEALLVNPETRRFSVATLGPVDLARLERQIAETLRSVDAVWQVEREARGLAGGGIVEKRIRDDLLLEKPTCLTAPQFWKWRDFTWPESPVGAPVQEEEEDWRKQAWLAGGCGVSLLIAVSVSGSAYFPSWVAGLAYGIAFVAGGWDAAQDTVAKLRQRVLDIHFLMLAVALGASAIGAYTEGALLLFLFSLSGALEHFALYRTHREIRSLIDAAPQTARRRSSSGDEETVPIECIVPGDLLVVMPDELFPVDGVIQSGKTAADESTLTGEATPVAKESGSEVFGGTLNLWGVAEYEASRPARESALQKVISLINDAQNRRAPSQRFTDRFGTRYTYLVLAATVAVFFFWWQGLGAAPWVGDGGAPSAFYRAMTFLVVASPCALVLSIPSAILAAIASGARQGILFRGGAAIEKLNQIDTVALDKTGTLTTGELRVVSVESFPEGQEATITRLAVSMEAYSRHPIARAITAYGKELGIEAVEVAGFEQIAGQGIRAKAGDRVCFLGRRELLQQGELAEAMATIPEPPPECSEVWVIHEGLLGRILLQDEIRTSSQGVVARLHAEGVDTVMLTGDRLGTAEKVGQEIGVGRIEAGLFPEDKVRLIEELGRDGRKVAMVGDGVNDAPGLAAAEVAIVMGTRGSDAALEQAEIVLMKDDLEKLLGAFRLSRRARRIIRQNIAISLGTVAVMMLVSIAGLIPLTIGVVAHEGSTVLVCLNSLRLLVPLRGA